MPQNRIPLKSYYYRPQGRRTIGRPKKRWRESSYNFGDGTDQRVQSLMFIMMTAILNCHSLVKASVFLDALVTKSVYQPLSVTCEAVLNELLDEGRSESKVTWRVNS